MCFMTSLRFCDMSHIKTNKNFLHLQYIFGFISMIPVNNLTPHQLEKYWFITYQMFPKNDSLNFDIVLSMAALLISKYSAIANFIT